MTTIITAHSATATDLQAYLDAFDAEFALSGFGAFSQGISGDYMGGVSAITDVAVEGDQAFAVRGGLEYDMATHTLGGTATGVEFGTGGSQDPDTGALSFASLDFSFAFSEEMTDGTEVRALLVDLMRNSDGVEGPTSTLRGLVEADSIEFKGAAGDDVFVGGGQADVLVGARGADMLRGGGGADVLNGNRGADELYGNAKADVLNGGGGADLLVGGRGKDELTGGKGADTFQFTGKYGRDTVTDFGTGRDVLAFSSNDVADFDAVMEVARQRGDDVVINTDAGLVRLLDTDLDSLGANDFDFI
ncbi:MAG: calcium-binding protein [Pseudomonadota bacterium]|nr:calcium-binding protein [Pseudomonadota bacterium]MEE3098888.1 calcium-binding protein [Pseudomonadota bacterium]